MSRRHLALLLVLPLLLAAAPFDPFGVAGIDGRPGARIPLTVALRDEQGRATTLARLAGGRVLLVAPVLHDCPNLCGVTLQGLADALKGAGLVADDDVAVIAFGIDPAETPAQARAALAKLTRRHPELAGRVHGTTGEAADVHAVTDALGYHYAFDPRIRQYAHAAAVAVLSADGRLSGWLYGLQPEAATLGAAVGEARAGRDAGFARQLLLLCYHYDPQTGRYAVATERLLRVGGLLTAAALGAYVLASRWRERRGRT